MASQFQHIKRLAVVGCSVCCLLYTFSLMSPTWHEGNLSVRIRTIDGSEPTNVDYRVLQLRTAPPGQGIVRMPMGPIRIGNPPVWRELNSRPLGWYRVLAIREAQPSVVLGSQDIFLWPGRANEVTITIPRVMCALCKPTD